MKDSAEHVTEEKIMQAILDGDETPTKPSKQVNNTAVSTERHQWGRKRKHINQKKSELSTVDLYGTLDRFKRRKGVRLSASSIAAMTGFHPYSNLAKLLMDLVYQGHVGKLLLQHDAKLLGVELVSEEEALKKIARKAGSAVQNAFQQVLDISHGNKKVKSVQVANGIKNDIVSMLDKSNLSLGEKKQLQKASQSGVNTGFGKEHEDEALDLYEDQCGYDVSCRNEDLKCWKFRRDDDKNIHPISPPVTYHYAEQKDQSPTSEREEIYFSILGVADGIRDEFYLKEENDASSDSNEDNLDIRKVVVECKHRMKRVFNPPPIYDQIQTVLYCMMYGTSEGEIIQVVRNSRKKEQTTKANVGVSDNSKQGNSTEADSKKTEKPISTSTTSITCNRISLDDPLMQHRTNWSSTILPRLASFVDAIYSVRQNDYKRYCMIQAAAQASSGGDESPHWDVLFKECPWLTDCDIALTKR